MSASCRFRRFSNPSILKRIAAANLNAFFGPFESYLNGRGLQLGSPGEIDYALLASILMAPDETMPDEMLDALFFVDEMSIPACFDDLMNEATALGIELAVGREPTTADLAVQIWLRNAESLERLHAERFLVKPKSFQTFLSTFAVLPPLRQPSPQQLTALQEELNDWFETHKRGRGTRVFVFIRDTRAWFLIRHGEPYRREGTLEGDESSSVYYRPEKFDVLTYNGELGELSIHAGTKGEKQIYCKMLGKHLFGGEDFFELDSTGGKYTLAPIVLDGPACLSCVEIEGIEEIALAELHFRHDSQQYHVEVHKADDVFAALQEIGRTIPESAQLLKATFRVTYENATRPRTLVIRPPAVTIVDRESDADVLERWMELRGFIQTDHADADAVLAVS